MIQVYYALFQKYYWHCFECMSSAEDIGYSKLLKEKKGASFNDTHQIIKNRISNNIRRIIKEKKTTYTELAEILKIKRSTLHYQLHPKNNPSLSTFIKISNALNVDFRRFLNDYKINQGIQKNHVIETTNEAIEKFSKNMANIMSQKNISKTQLANELNLHKTNVGYKISSKNNPRIDTIIDLAKKLEVEDLSDFFI